MALRIVLASQSPRRREILAAAGLPFSVRSAGIPERRGPRETPQAYVTRLAREKAEAVAMSEGEVILGADTVVVVEHRILEKPRDAAEAAWMLGLLSAKEHEVLTGICLRTHYRLIIDSAITRVRIAPLTALEISGYVSSGEPMDKAGAYAIQGLASKFIERVDGCYFNVVGLPISLVYRRLKEFGPDMAPPLI